MNFNVDMATVMSGAIVGSVVTARVFNSWAKKTLEIDGSSNIYEYIIKARHVYEMNKKAEEARATEHIRAMFGGNGPPGAPGAGGQIFGLQPRDGNDEEASSKEDLTKADDLSRGYL